MKVSGLPEGTEETNFREWLGEKLPQELLGLVYHVAMVEDGESCYLSFITHKAMREAKSKLGQVQFSRNNKVTVSAEDITRTELVATALNITIGDDDGIPPLSFWLSKSDVVTNLIIMVFVWLITVFNFYLIGFLVNTFDQIFYSSIAAGLSEFFAQAASGYLFEKIGVRQSLCISYTISAIGGFMMFFYGLNHQGDWIFPLLVLVMKFGISGAFNITYVCHKGCFPTLFSATSLGYCTFICRFFTAFTPVMAGLSQSISTGLFAVGSLFATFIVLGLKDINDSDYKWTGNAGSLK